MGFKRRYIIPKRQFPFVYAFIGVATPFSVLMPFVCVVAPPMARLHIRNHLFLFVYFEHTRLRTPMVCQIDPVKHQLHVNKANSSDTEAPFLDLNLSISNGIIPSKLDDFNFEIVFPIS